MKKLVLIFFLSAFYSNAQTIFSVDYKSQAKGNEGLWYFVDYKSQADFNIYFVDYKSQADLKIFFVDYKSQAGWQSKEKKHLLY